MSDITFTLEETETKGRFVARVEGFADEAEITFSKSSPTMVIVDHTGVPDALRGTGAGLALVERLVADARAEGWKIVPLCPFVRAYAEKHRKDLVDVIQW